jgi:hypothetical protein
MLIEGIVTPFVFEEKEKLDWNSLKPNLIAGLF